MDKRIERQLAFSLEIDKVKKCIQADSFVK